MTIATRLPVMALWMLVSALSLGASASTSQEESAPHFQALADLEPAEQQRQLGLMLLVSVGVDDAMLEAMEVEAQPPGDNAFLKPGDYTAPLARIVDQKTLLAGAASLFRFVKDNEGSIRERMKQLDSTSGQRAEGALDPPSSPKTEPVQAVSAPLDEDVVLIRQAIADSMIAAGEERLAEHVRRYRSHTVVLRNALEYAQFQADLNRLTDQAIASVGGKLDAYQRMFDSEINSGDFDERIRSAELIYLPEGEFDPRAGELTDEMLEAMMLLESNPNR